MDFISQTEYITVTYISCMYLKHGVWCQCASVFTFVLAASSVLSLQHLTLTVDVYWSLVLLVVASLHFILAEHAPVFGFFTETWFKLHPDSMVHACLFGWSLMRWQPTAGYVGLAVVASALLYRKPVHVLVVACATRFVLTWDACLLTMLALLATYYRRPDVRNKSIASREQKQRFLIKSTQILLQSVALWLLRCEHRFPHVVRWTPIISGLVGIGVAAVWCHFNVAVTRVSRNAIIVDVGHGMAASLKAAEACPVCSRHLTALDMESSF